jgi:HTH-type transcriptional regulator/antitoxin HigA
MTINLKDERELLSRPGDTILETLEHFKMTQTEFAARMGKTPSKVNDIISGKEPITVNTALQLEKVLNINADFWLSREMRYREKLTRIEQEEFLEQCAEWVRKHPVKELKRCGYLKSDRIGSAMAEELLQFFGVASPAQCESMYIQQYTSANYRRSPAHTVALSSMSAWLRIGELELRKMNLPEYSKDRFKEVLTALQPVAREHPSDFANQVQLQCAAAGVAVVFTICLPKAPVSGATRWIGGTPLIQMTDRHKTNDHFWFTLYHEAGHVLLHGKKDVFLENFEGYRPDKEKEIEADQFALKWLVSEKLVDELPFEINEEDIIELADKYKTHPGILIGRLQHMGIVPFSFGNSLKKTVRLFK